MKLDCLKHSLASEKDELLYFDAMLEMFSIARKVLEQKRSDRHSYIAAQNKGTDYLCTILKRYFEDWRLNQVVRDVLTVAGRRAPTNRNPRYIQDRRTDLGILSIDPWTKRKHHKIGFGRTTVAGKLFRG